MFDFSFNAIISAIAIIGGFPLIVMWFHIRSEQQEVKPNLFQAVDFVYLTGEVDWVESIGFLYRGLDGGLVRNYFDSNNTDTLYELTTKFIGETTYEINVTEVGVTANFKTLQVKVSGNKLDIKDVTDGT